MEIQEQEIRNLISKARDKDQEAFAQIYKLFFEKIYKFIFFRTKLKEEAEDLTSLIFLKVWQGLPKYKFRSDAKFSTWLFQVARFTLIDYYRKQKVQISLDEIKELGVSGFAEREVQIDEIKKYILLLPEKYQTVINLRYFGDLSFEQIAKIMGRTSVGVRVLLHRALKKLSNLVEIKND